MSFVPSIEETEQLLEPGLGGLGSPVRAPNLSAVDLTQSRWAGLYSQVSEDDIDTWARAAITYDPHRWGDGASTPYLRQMVRRLLLLSENNPELLQLAEQHFNVAAATSEAAWFGLTFGKGETPTPARLTTGGGQALEAAADMVQRLDLAFLSPQRAAERVEKWADIHLELGKLRVPWEPQQYSVLTPAQVEELGNAEVGGGFTYREQWRKAEQSLIWNIPGDVTPLRAALTDGGRRLLIAVRKPEREQVGGDDYAYVDVLLEEGTRIRNSYDALLAMEQAVTGRKHRLGGMSADPLAMAEPKRNPLSWVGDTIDAVGRAWDNTDAWLNYMVAQAQEAWDTFGPSGDRRWDDPGGTFASTTTMRGLARDQQIKKVRAEVDARITSTEGLIVQAARQIYDENRGMPLTAAVQAGEELILAMPEAEVQRARQIMVDTATAEGVDEQIAASLPSEDSRLGRAASKTLDFAVHGLAMLGDASLWLTTHALDITWDTAQGLLDTVGLPSLQEGQEAGPTNPVEAFKNAWDWTEANTPGDYFGLGESGWGMMLDMAALVGTDLFLIPTLGAGKTAARNYAMLTDPAQLPALLNRPIVRHLAADVVRAVQQDDLLQVVALTRGMDWQHILRLTKARTRQQVLDVFADAVPAGGKGGLWMMDLTGHRVTRNSALLVERLSRIGGADSKTGDVLAKLFGGFARDRRLSVAEGAFPDEAFGLIMQLHRSNRNAARYWVNRVLTQMESQYTRRAGQLLSADTIDTLAREMRALRRNVPADLTSSLRRHGFRGTTWDEAQAFLKAQRTGQGRLTAIDNELAELRATAADPAALLAKEAEARAIRTGRWDEYRKLTSESRRLRRQYALKPGQVTDSRPLMPAETRARLQEVNDRLRVLSKQPMIRGAALSDDLLTDGFARHAAYKQQAKELRLRYEAARAHAKSLEAANLRAENAQLLGEMLDWYGRNTLRLGEVPGRIDPLTGRAALDWRPVTGSERHHWDESVDRMAPLTTRADGTVDEAVREGIYRAGFFDQQSYFPLPASPQRLVAYEMRQSDAVWQHVLASNVLGAQTVIGKPVQMLAVGLQRAFSTILLAPRIAFRSGTDEMIRWYAETGRARGGLRAGSVADVLSDTRAGMRLPGPAVGQITQFGPGRQFADRTATALRQSFSQTPMVSRTDPTAWSLVSGRKMPGQVVYSKKLHREAVLRWVNSPACLDDPAVRAWATSVQATARAQGKTVWQVIREASLSDWDASAFRSYWQTTGRWRRRVTPVGQKGLRLGGEEDALRTMTSSFRLLGERSDDAELVVGMIVDRAASGGKLGLTSGEERIIRAFGPMPTDAAGATGSLAHRLSSAPGRMQDFLFDRMYGVPGANRFGYIHADYYDQALRTLTEGSRGRILTPELVAQKTGMKLDEAVLLMNQNVHAAQQIAREHNLVTTQMIEAAADSFARRHALHLMYQPGATSMLGGVFQRYVAPFGPAQYDFLSWWGNYATRATAVRMFGPAAGVPDVVRAGLERLAGAAEMLPVNLRFLTRAGEYAKVTEMATERAAEVGRPADGGSVLDRISRLSPLNVVEELSFLPRLDDLDNFLVDLSPAVGPIPAWLIRLAPDESEITDESSLWAKVMAEVRHYAEAISPAIEWGNESEMSWGSLFNAMFPDYEGSSRDLLEMFTHMLTGGAVGDQEPFMYRESWDAVYAERLAERTGFLPLDPGTTEEAEFLSELSGEAEGRAKSDDWRLSLARWLPGGRLLFGPDDLATPMWEGFIGDLPDLLTEGWVGADIAGNVEALWAVWKDGSINYEQQQELHDQLRNILFDLASSPEGKIRQAWLVARNPELAIPMVSRYEAVWDEKRFRYRGPDDAATADGSPNLPGGPDGRKKLSQGIEQGWYRPKSEKQRHAEIQWRLAQAQRTILRSAYEQLTGKNWPASNASNAMLAHQYTVTPALREALTLAGVDGDNLTDLMSGVDLFAEISYTAQALANVEYPRTTVTGIESPLLRDDEWGRGLLDNLDSIQKAMTDKGFMYPSEWPENVLAAIRQDFGSAIHRELLDESEYARLYQRDYGPLDYEPPAPPVMADLPAEAVILRADPEDVFIIDGDTVDLMLADATTRRFRLIGVNAPDDPMPGSAEAFDDLYDLLRREGFRDVALVIWQPEVFGLTAGTDYGTGQPRYKAWLYVNGQPVFNPAVFTHRNPLGIGSGHEFVRLPRPYQVEGVS